MISNKKSGDFKKQNIDVYLIDESRLIPRFISIKESKIHGKGIFCKKKIKKGTFLGNYMGNILNYKKTGPYIFHSIKENKLISIDATDIEQSNWTRYMNCSLNDKSENVTSYFLTNNQTYLKNNQPINLEGYIVFYANRDIEKHEELMYNYGEEYVDILKSLS